MQNATNPKTWNLCWRLKYEDDLNETFIPGYLHDNFGYQLKNHECNHDENLRWQIRCKNVFLISIFLWPWYQERRKYNSDSILQFSRVIRLYRGVLKKSMRNSMLFLTENITKEKKLKLSKNFSKVFWIFNFYLEQNTKKQHTDALFFQSSVNKLI